jgi:PAS domain S-box-containing protein
LIVEDREADADLMLLELRHLYRVSYVRVETEEQYLHHLGGEPDVIISDYDLPRFSGLRALQLLRSRDTETPFILVSGAIPEGEAAATLPKGANDYLLKSSLVRLGPAIEKALEQRRTVRAKQEAEDLYHQSEARYQALFEQAGEAVIVIDADSGSALEANPRAAELFGRSLTDIVGKVLRSLFPESSRAAYDACLQELAVGGAEVNAGEAAGQTARLETRIVRPDGTEADVDVSAARVQVAEGRSVVQAFIRDVTERNRLQRELAAQRDKLEETVEVRTAELSDAVAQLEATVLRLEEASRHKSQFLRSMSHELRTPLNSILGFADLLTSGFVGQLSDQQMSYVQQIEAGGSHLLGLIGDLLDVARIDSGSVVLERSLFSPEQMCDTIARMLGAQTRDKRLRLTVTHHPDVGLVEADLQKARQIMLNLLTNAVKFTPNDGAITIATEPEGHDWVRVTVSDTGCGISEIDLPRVFDEFYQSDRKRDQALGGTGIGLALTRRLVELHGGSIGVESSLGGGATFRFTLPMKPGPGAGIAPTPDNGAPEAANGRAKPTVEVGSWVGELAILVVTDDGSGGDLLETALRARRHRVVRAASYAEARGRIAAFTPDGVILDLDRGMTEALDLARRLRQDARFRGAPIVLLGSDVTDELAREAQDIGTDALMAKPLQPSIVMTEIVRLVAKRLRAAPTE